MIFMGVEEKAGTDRYVLKMVVDSRKGVMARIATLLARKGYNILSISVGRHIEEGEAIIVLAIQGTEAEIFQAKNMLGKLVNVISIESFHKSDVVERELCLLKIKSEGKKKAEELMKGLNAKILAEGKGSIVIEVVDYPNLVGEFTIKALAQLPIIEISRSGPNAI